ncbi:hypothetical protein SRIMHP_36830 [Streptomyces rimosus subsp. rimosus]|uniref:DUF7683 domain-containing protein n=2 Tax=Streptomyces rimosus TaxID=1927 RepID=A0ABY3YU91_STRRM|nr:hypothetical protein SRIMR7_05150 [Streptomyces rimosus subsp. rimosus]UTH99710.1 hypothetical protein SRIMHP_36830 [Streptomyces rimosus subsp. rimosus]UTJ17808.1 hypothetical protein SRIMDV3_36725 [Streptomyces rimosus subsp. rimosus]UTJ19236.1 hypothetical protein SRIMDV3_43985 [Streptomyces rimosus subsp. rimosus]
MGFTACQGEEVRIFVTEYRSDSDFPERQMDVTCIGLQAAAELVDVLVDRFVHVYPLNEEQVDALRELTGETFHPGGYEYFIEAVED